MKYSYFLHTVASAYILMVSLQWAFRKGTCYLIANRGHWKSRPIGPGKVEIPDRMDCLNTKRLHAFPAGRPGGDPNRGTGGPSRAPGVPPSYIRESWSFDPGGGCGSGGWGGTAGVVRCLTFPRDFR